MNEPEHRPHDDPPGQVDHHETMGIPAHMAEFRRQAATDDTPDPLDTRIAERPL